MKLFHSTTLWGSKFTRRETQADHRGLLAASLVGGALRAVLGAGGILPPAGGVGGAARAGRTSPRSSFPSDRNRRHCFTASTASPPLHPHPRNSKGTRETSTFMRSQSPRFAIHIVINNMNHLKKT